MYSEQLMFFAEEVYALRQHKTILNRSSLMSVSPFLNFNSVLCVEGRLEKSDLPFLTKHPIILSPKSDLTRLIVSDIHVSVTHHQGVDSHANACLLFTVENSCPLVSGHFRRR